MLRSVSKKKAAGIVISLLLATGVVLGGCGKNAPRQQGAVQVKVMKVIKQDTPLTYEYAGEIHGQNEVLVKPKVSGTIVEKYITGGQIVNAGQALYKIDSRQYESAVLSAKADLAKSEANLANSQIDLHRFEALFEADAIAEQSLTTQRSVVSQNEAIVAANAALLKRAQENLDDTLVCAPMDGRLDVNDVAVGVYARAGDTTLLTLGTIDPVYVRFSISETQYLSFMKMADQAKKSNADDPGNERIKVTITLANGEDYPLEGKVTETDRALSNSTGTLAVKALFPNPKGYLLPGMFARVKLGGEVARGALLIPERAVQQLLDKTFVNIVGADGKSDTRQVVLGNKVGSYFIVTEGLTADDKVIVEGLTKLQKGMEVNATIVEGKDLGLTFDSPKPEKNNK